jgi:iron transport multicopper oxidase
MLGTLSRDYSLIPELLTDLPRYFIGGTVLQRPSLTMINGVVIGAFGGHCDLFNYTGMLMGVSTTAGIGVTSLYAMEASPGAPAVVSDITVQAGGKAGIWQGGMGLATDGSRLFLATGYVSRDLKAEPC